MNQFSIIFVLTLYIYGYLSKTLSCTANCKFGSSINVGGVIIPLAPNELCYETNTDEDLIIDVTKNGLAECLGIIVPKLSVFFCENNGDQECMFNCGCGGYYSSCSNNVRIIKRNDDMICVQKEGNVKDVAFYPSCSEEVKEMCGTPSCPCVPCTDGEFRLKDKNHCGEGYYLCENKSWTYKPVNETTICAGSNTKVECQDQPYCQAGPNTCYNGKSDVPVCKLPTNNTCVKPCVAGKGYWECTVNSCKEVISTTLDMTNTACHDTPNGPEWVNLLDFNNVCQCPNTDCTTTPKPDECPDRPPHHPDGQPNPDVCPKEYGNFCLTPYKRGVGFVKCHHYVPLYIRIQEFEICIQTDPTHIVVKESY